MGLVECEAEVDRRCVPIDYCVHWTRSAMDNRWSLCDVKWG
jgi:hypothetical protein